MLCGFVVRIDLTVPRCVSETNSVTSAARDDLIAIFSSDGEVLTNLFVKTFVDGTENHVIRFQFAR